MEGDQVTADTITAVASGLFPRRHHLTLGGDVLGELTVGLGWSVPFTDPDGGQAWMQRVSLWRREYRMVRDDQERARARVRPFRWQVEIEFEGRPYLLRPTSLTLGPWELLDGGDGSRVLAARRVGWGRTELSVRAELDSDLLVFAYYLVIMRRRAARRRHHPLAYGFAF